MSRLVNSLALSGILLTGTAAAAADSESLLGKVLATPVAASQGSYLRFELGAANTDFTDGNWLPPGQSDPRIFFDIDNHSVGYGAIAIGRDWKNGFRGDVALTLFGRSDVTAPEGEPNPPDADQHASITGGSVKSTALMANMFYSPLEHKGDNSPLQPFLVLGLGASSNKMGEWTRTNSQAERPDRTFAGATHTSLAWSVGVGASYKVERAGKAPIMIEGAVRFYDLGTAKGGAEAVPAGGHSSPQEPLNFDVRHAVASVGVRIPLSWH